MLMLTQIERVNKAIQDLKDGKMIILTDHADRENEGDLIAAAETLTTEQMNFIIRHSSGIVCLTLTNDRVKKLNLPPMVPIENNTSCYHTPFTISIDAKVDVTTGVSAADRIKTIQVAIDEATLPEDLVKPGHIFPLQAKNGGVLERQGHTEGSIDLVKLANLKPAAVLSEIMNADGTMARGEELIAFAETYQLTMLSIEDIVTYRLSHENMIEEEVSAKFPLEKYGSFKFSVIKEKYNGTEHIVLSRPAKNANAPLLVRIHSACTTGDLFSSNRCDCHKQFHHALQCISEDGGMLIYLNQEGRGIGLFNKIKAYALQEQGLDTVEANEELGLPIDSRKYYIAANVLRNQGIAHIRLLTNNPRKINDLKKYGISHIDRTSMPSFHNEHNQRYLTTKKLKLNHTINFDFLPEFKRSV
jgi:3,4-dihydroxy 2-butanone 4-phosphate synthase/GTP cyclohydrolase II